jgi:hypothetical protein
LAGEGVVGAGVGEESGFQGVSITRKAGGGARSWCTIVHECRWNGIRARRG